MSKQPRPESQHAAGMKKGLSLSGKALIELMRAVHSKGLPFRFIAGGHSMAPFIRDGDVVSVSPISSRPPNPGDVVAFIHPETKRLCIHRVLTGNQDAFLLQGDNMPGKPDGMIPRGSIMGRVTRVERRGIRVRLGLGPERFLIALLNHRGLLPGIRKHAGPLYACFRRRQRLCVKG
ncbi:MAG: S26 family signal peptidase [Deltaproteobacteria bacterium]|nr:S26 family signal peptidase [Deltaproteobacteria bacterium]